MERLGSRVHDDWRFKDWRVWFRKYAFEIIVVDDNSPDGTQDVVKKLQGVYGEDKVVG